MRARQGPTERACTIQSKEKKKKKTDVKNKLTTTCREETHLGTKNKQLETRRMKEG
jgi:hypothetical protein